MIRRNMTDAPEVTCSLRLSQAARRFTRAQPRKIMPCGIGTAPWLGPADEWEMNGIAPTGSVVPDAPALLSEGSEAI